MVAPPQVQMWMYSADEVAADEVVNTPPRHNSHKLSKGRRKFNRFFGLGSSPAPSRQPDNDKTATTQQQKPAAPDDAASRASTATAVSRAGSQGTPRLIVSTGNLVRFNKVAETLTTNTNDAVKDPEGKLIHWEMVTPKPKKMPTKMPNKKPMNSLNSGCSFFNKLPAELRLDIYRYAIVEPNGINLRTTNEKRQPALLWVSRQFRAEAIPIYYGENTFSFVAYDMDLRGCIYFMRLQRLYSVFSYMQAPGSVLLELAGRANWKNLLASAKLHHELKAVSFDGAWKDRAKENPNRRAVLVALSLVDRYMEWEWQQVEELLKVFVEGLRAGGKDWRDDETFRLTVF